MDDKPVSKQIPKTDFRTLTLTELNELFPSKESIFNTLIEIGYSLPHKNIMKMTAEYLFKVFANEVFTIRRKELKVGFSLSKTSKAELIQILQSLTPNIPLGFDELHPPEHDWLINCIHTLKADHNIFEFVEAKIEEPTREIDYG